jgi:hypothetical protein
MNKQLQMNLFFLMAVVISLLGLGTTATKIKASESTVGCPHCGPKEPVPVTTGFYRQVSDPKVYFLDLRKNTMCHVQNPSQMEAFGGFEQVRITLDYSFKSDKKFIEGCTWPPDCVENPMKHLSFLCSMMDVTFVM